MVGIECIFLLSNLKLNKCYGFKVIFIDFFILCVKIYSIDNLK